MTVPRWLRRNGSARTIRPACCSPDTPPTCVRGIWAGRRKRTRRFVRRSPRISPLSSTGQPKRGAAGSWIQGQRPTCSRSAPWRSIGCGCPALAIAWPRCGGPTMLARGIDPDVDLDDPLALPAPQQYHLQNYAAFLAATAESDADLRRALAAQRACVRVRDQVTHGELAVYGAKFTSARTSRQAAAAIAGRLLAALGGTGTGSAEYRDVLAEGVAHARAAIENPTTAVLLGDVRVDGSADGRDGPEVARLAIAVLPVIVAAWERQRDSLDGSGVLVDDALLAAADTLLTATTGGAVVLAPALPEADQVVLADLRRRRDAPTRAAYGWSLYGNSQCGRLAGGEALPPPGLAALALDRAPAGDREESIAAGMSACLLGVSIVLIRSLMVLPLAAEVFRRCGWECWCGCLSVMTGLRIITTSR